MFAATGNGMNGMLHFRMMRRWRACAPALGLVVALAGCAPRGERMPDVEEIPGVTPAPGGLRFSVRVNPARFVPGDRVTLEASLFNDSEDDYKERFDTNCIWDFGITSEDGLSLSAARECIPQDSTLVLAPGELRMIVRNWSGRERYFNAAQPLAAGRYLIVAGFLDADHRVIPMSAPVEVEVIERRGGR
ncbi:MAG TPA: hypothetical protein VFT13_13705 [Candidatus Krumholzibacteria bacterium]|nr:hypothetical protein [Candidatus Krumholzibacteria bacterium]